MKPTFSKMFRWLRNLARCFKKLFGHLFMVKNHLGASGKCPNDLPIHRGQGHFKLLLLNLPCSRPPWRRWWTLTEVFNSSLWSPLYIFDGTFIVYLYLSSNKDEKNSGKENNFVNFCERAEYFLFCLLLYDTSTVFRQLVFTAYSFLRKPIIDVLT